MNDGSHALMMLKMDLGLKRMEIKIEGRQGFVFRKHVIQHIKDI
jgi:hypothetical protein